MVINAVIKIDHQYDCIVVVGIVVHIDVSDVAHVEFLSLAPKARVGLRDDLQIAVVAVPDELSYFER